MKTSVPSMIVQVVILFIAVVFTPIYYMSIIQYQKDVNRTQVAVRNFIDSVIDNRQVTEEAEAELAISLASTMTPLHYEIKRETRIINPSDENVTGVQVSWVYIDWSHDTVWLQGDLITVEVTQDSPSLFQQLSQAFLGSSFSELKMNVTGMVR